MDTVDLAGAVGAPTRRAKSLNLPLTGRLREGRGGFQPLAQAGQLGENREVAVKLVRMKVIHRIDRQFDNAAPRTDGQAQFDAEPFEGGIHVVAIHLQQFAAGERSAGVQLAAAGARGEIAREGDPKAAGLLRGRS
jgi:hypothetical protein